MASSGCFDAYPIKFFLAGNQTGSRSLYKCQRMRLEIWVLPQNAAEDSIEECEPTIGSEALTSFLSELHFPLEFFRLFTKTIIPITPIKRARKPSNSKPPMVPLLIWLSTRVCLEP